MDLEFRFLGTGTSVGVPVIGCRCEVCTSADRRNRRTRSSALIRTRSHALLIDSGPDLREQSLREQLTEIDAVLYTHSHVDHVVGFDELRAFCWRRSEPLPLHACPETLGVLKRMFSWAFLPDNTYPGYVKPLAVPFSGPFSYGDLAITPLPVTHGSVDTHGFLFEHPMAPSIAYIPDVKALPPTTRERLQGIDVLILDSLRPRSHPTHLSNDEAIALIEDLEAGRAWLTHLGHENDHAAFEAILPDHIRIAHDGLTLPL
ncbi:MBL fold metallo-hydrolase [Haloferula sargassicola]